MRTEFIPAIQVGVRTGEVPLEVEILRRREEQLRYLPGFPSWVTDGGVPPELERCRARADAASAEFARFGGQSRLAVDTLSAEMESLCRRADAALKVPEIIVPSLSFDTNAMTRGLDALSSRADYVNPLPDMRSQFDHAYLSIPDMDISRADAVMDYLRTFGEMPSAFDLDASRYDICLAHPHHDVRRDCVLFSTASFDQVSGHAAKTTFLEIKALEQTQRVLDEQIGSLRSQWVEFLRKAELELEAWLPMVTALTCRRVSLVREWIRTKARLDRLFQRLRAMKKEMRRRQRAVFAGLDPAKKVWHLLHGTHPPETLWVLNLEWSSGRVRA